jgi:hypothetical protein
MSNKKVIKQIIIEGLALLGMLYLGWKVIELLILNLG